MLINELNQSLTNIVDLKNTNPIAIIFVIGIFIGVKLFQKSKVSGVLVVIISIICLLPAISPAISNDILTNL